MIEIFQDEGGEWRFRVKANNGEIVAQSEGYEKKSGAVRGVAAIIRIASDERLDIQVIE